MTNAVNNWLLRVRTKTTRLTITEHEVLFTWFTWVTKLTLRPAVRKSAKKERKREQNKTAALRYRQKKKEEKSDIETRRAELEEKNEKLKAEVNSLSNEINYLKKLWSEVCRNKKQLEESKLS